MKLYTEEQVRKAINDGSLYSYINGDFEFKNSEDDIINALIPIELPSDEEVQNMGKYVIVYNDTKRGWFVEGLRFMRDKIQGGNK